MTAPTTFTSITITVNGKDFIVCPPCLNMGNAIGTVYYDYFSTRDGKRFGPIRTAAECGGAKSVGRQLAVAAREQFGPEAVDARMAQLIADQIEYTRKKIAEIDPADRWADGDIEFYGKQLAALEAAQAS
jgi:hypothetical protein